MAVLQECTACNRVLLRRGVRFFFFCTPLLNFSISYEQGQLLDGEKERGGVLVMSWRPVAGFFLRGILYGRVNNEEVRNCVSITAAKGR